jgi:hypothetical protein
MLATDFSRFIVGGCFLLVVTLLPTEATPVPSAAPSVFNGGTHSSTKTDREKYKELRAAILERYPGERLIQDFVINAHCPFQVLTVRNITRIMCDVPRIRNCKSNRDYCEDISNNCHQAYIKVAYIVASARQIEKIEIGCIYHPGVIGISVETQDHSSGGIII